MFDVDCLTQLNQAHGPQATSSVLRALPNVMRSALAHDGLLLRIQGKQFVLSLPDSSLDHGAEIVERLRQQVEQTTFAASTGPLRLTVSAAVLEHRPAENALATLARLRSTIVEVKSYGRNRTFLLEDDIPTPVMPPKLSLPASTVRL
jgi:diguanylate cyclase (GGDEF)-like protein